MHERIRGLLAEHAAGGLGSDERELVEAHLAGCPDCRAELAEWRVLAGAVSIETAGRVEEAPPWAPPESAPPSPAPSLASSAARPAYRIWIAMLILGLVIGVAITVRLGPSERLTDLWRQGLEIGGDGSGLVSDLDDPDSGERDAMQGPRAAERRTPRRIDRLPTAVARVGPSAAGLGPDGRQDARQDARLLAQARSAAPLPTSLPSANVSQLESPTAPLPTTTPTEAPPPAAGGGSKTVQPRPSDPPQATQTPLPSLTPIVLATSTASPTQPTTAWLRGRVHGPDGYPRAEIPVIVERLEASGERFVADTDIEGRYAFELPPGRWILHAEAPAYQLMWHAGQPNPLHADPIELEAGDERTADFYLEPHPDARVEGRIVDGADRPLAGVLILAAYPPDPAGQESTPRFVWSTFSREDGRFFLALPPGVWYLAAAKDWRTDGPSWWGGDGSLLEADSIGLSAGRVPEITWILAP